MEFAEPLYRAGLLSHDEREVKGRKVVPFDLIVDSIPAPPKFAREIKEIIDEGIVSDDGCMVVEAYGQKDGKNILVENHISAPGLVEAFERARHDRRNVSDRSGRISVFQDVCKR